jgi:hypothetical protein
MIDPTPFQPERAFFMSKQSDTERELARGIVDGISAALTETVGERLDGLDQSLIDVQRTTASALRGIDAHISEVKGLAVAAARPRSQGRPVSPRTVIIRSAVAHIVAYVMKTDPEPVAARLYGPTVAGVVTDLAGFVTKSQVNPAAITIAGWAAELVGPARLSALAMLAPRSTFAQLQARGLTLDFNGFSTVRLPARSGSGDLAGDFVGESSPIPVKKAAFTAGTLMAHKFGVISTFTREMAAYSTPAFEACVKDMISSDAASAVDVALLGSGAASAVRAAGLLNGLTSLTPTTGGGLAAVAGDFAALAGAIPSSVDLVYLMAEATRVRALALAPGLAGVTIISSAAIPATRIVALDANDFFSASADPSFDVSEESVTVPNTVPGVAMDPGTTSIWQQGLIGLRFLETTTWGMRQAGRVAFVDPISW